MSPLAANLYYTLSRGDAPLPLVLIHGAGGSRLSWPAALRRLPGYPVYTLDLPGHGRSPQPPAESIDAYAAAVADFMGALQLPPAVVVGHSMGSAIALVLALHHPSRVRGLVLIGGGARLRVNAALLEWAADPRQVEKAIQAILDWGFAPQVPPDLKARAAAQLRQTPAAALYADLRACDRFDLRPQLERVLQPTLILCGSADRMTPLALSEFLAEHLPVARLQLVEGAGHMLMLERPETVQQALKSFLSELL